SAARAASASSASGRAPGGDKLCGKDPTGRFRSVARSVVVQDRAEAERLDEAVEDAVVAEELDEKSLVRLPRAVAGHLDGVGLARLAGSEGQRAVLGGVVFAGLSGLVRGEVPDGHGVVEGGGERDGEGERGRLTIGALGLRRVADADANIVVHNGA